MSFLAQIIGGFAISVWVVSIQNEKREKVLFLQGIANLLYSAEYFLLGAFTASVMNFVSAARCFTFSYSFNKSIKQTHVSLLIFSLLIILFGIFTYDGILSLIPIVITLFYTISSYFKNIFWNRIAVLVAAIIWIYYNFTVGAYITIVGNVFEIVSGIISIIRFRKKVS